MAKIISRSTKRNIVKVKKKLENEFITFKFFGQPEQVLMAGDALLLGGRLLSESKELQSLQIATQLVEKFPDIIDVHLLKIRALIALEELVEASKLADALLSRASDNVGVLVAVARLTIILCDASKALKLLSKANRKRPGNIEILSQIGDCYRLTGNNEQSMKISRECLRIAQNQKENDYRQYIAALLGVGEWDEFLQEQHHELEDILRAESEAASLCSHIAFIFSKQASKNKNIEEESKYLTIANAKMAESIGQTLTTKEFEKNCIKHFELQQEIFLSSMPNWLRGIECNTDIAPIFVIGMPRSGTTLLEQILGAHSLVGQTGESKALRIGISQAYIKHQPMLSFNDYPLCYEKMPLHSIEEIARYYEEYQNLLTHKEFYIDKELSSFKFVGLAAHLFPKAKFIHMNRSPMDIFLSCYRGSIPGIPATCNLEHMAIYYIYMKKLIGHWNKIYPDKVLILDYAALVNEPEDNIRKVLRFLNLEFEPQVMEFHKRKNVVRTLSVNQVRQSIYKTSVKKWVPFTEMLEPARKILERYGVEEDGVSVL